MTKVNDFAAFHLSDRLLTAKTNLALSHSFSVLTWKISGGKNDIGLKMIQVQIGTCSNLNPNRPINQSIYISFIFTHSIDQFEPEYLI